MADRTNTEFEKNAKIMEYEKKNLLNETRVPITLSNSRFYIIGINPYNDFSITVKLCKQNKEYDALTFTCTAFNEIIRNIPDILDNKNQRDEYELSTHLITILTDNRTLVKIMEKSSGKYDIFQKFTLEKLLKIRSFHEYITEEYEKLRLSETFNSILQDLIVEILRDDQHYYDNNMFKCFIEARPRYNNYMIWLELLNKFDFFVYSNIGRKLNVTLNANRYYV